MLDNYADLWEALADGVGDRQAIVQGDRIRTWSSLDDRASRLAAAYADAGVGPGSYVAIDLWNSPENVEAIFAAFKLRAVPFNINYRYRERELTYLLNDAEPAVLVFDASLSERIDNTIRAVDFPVLPVAVNASGEMPKGFEDFEALIAGHAPAPRIERRGDDEYIIYTGGTTGYPKGVVWPHTASRHLRPGVATAEEYAAWIRETDPPDTRLVIAPLMHASGLLRVTSTLSVGGRVLFCTSRSLDPAEVLSLVEEHRATGFSVTGDAVARPILEELDRAAAAGRPYDLSSVEEVSNTGGIWSAGVKRGFLRHGSFTVVDGLGASEAGGFASSEARSPEEVGTATFRLGPTSRILAVDGRDVEPGSGEIGVLATTGFLPKGYLHDPEKTAATWPTIDGVRYCVPGDLATLEADGTVILLGRGSEVINTGGEKVFVEEVEIAILTHDAVRDALVVGLPDERWGNRVTAVVSLKAGRALSERELIDHVGAEIADYKRPRQVVFVEEIPRSPSGKADRPHARQLAEAASGAPASGTLR